MNHWLHWFSLALSLFIKLDTEFIIFQPAKIRTHVVKLRAFPILLSRRNTDPIHRAKVLILKVFVVDWNDVLREFFDKRCAARIHCSLHPKLKKILHDISLPETFSSLTNS